MSWTEALIIKEEVKTTPVISVLLIKWVMFYLGVYRTTRGLILNTTNTAAKRSIIRRSKTGPSLQQVLDKSPRPFPPQGPDRLYPPCSGHLSLKRASKSPVLQHPSALYSSPSLFLFIYLIFLIYFPCVESAHCSFSAHPERRITNYSCLSFLCLETGVSLESSLL